MKTGVFADTPYNQLRRKFAAELPDDDGFALLNKWVVPQGPVHGGSVATLIGTYMKKGGRPFIPSLAKGAKMLGSSQRKRAGIVFFANFQKLFDLKKSLKREPTSLEALKIVQANLTIKKN